MEIERVNDSTIKFYITYKDIEDRGFDRDEIWYSRERSEELFFEMMNEAHDREDFEIEGPLWIQVQALEKGLEIVVTRGQISDGSVKLEIPVSSDKGTDLPVDHNIVDMLDAQFRDNLDTDEEQLELVIGFSDFEDIISLSHSFINEQIDNSLYHFEGRYYLHVTFNDDEYNEDEQDNMLSQILEFGYESELTVCRLQEYGKAILLDDAITSLRQKFSKR
ncbi:adaptor protein MecA [Alkalihalobacillus sp. LMS39]|uniref:adaptor protein MecA n=1 Tax=Alkalihalobacillus sp. LMS39 TaxID=2924032 RepID=UPI001FB2F683|nr:adaptor protein MecA [Alkalihalobacillus sp. LMS39]UOE93149.1 adaptor protein MecA [Alkalihalobacillus sp. LMS39]